MSTIKRERGRPSAPMQYSLVSKMLTIAPGEKIYLHEGNPDKKEWLSERNVHTVMSRSPHLKGMRFTTERTVSIARDPLRVVGMLSVTRLEGERDR